MTTMERKQRGEAPELLKDDLFMSKVRDELVELGREPGLGLRVMGRENAVIVIPRAGTPPSTLEDYLRFRWMDVDADTLTFTLMEPDDVRAFLLRFAPAT